MNRKAVADSKVGKAALRGFRYRGHEVSRLEAFSDAVFAFAITLLVVSLEVPKTFTQLKEAMSGFFGFGICFAMLILVWYDHFRFFRKYGLDDGWVVLYNSLLLFVVLFYVYPLKFLFNMLIMGLSKGNVMVEEGGKQVQAIDFGQLPQLMVIYGAGFAAIHFCLAALYGHAYRKRVELGLDEYEAFHTRSTFIAKLGPAFIALLSIGLALVLPANWTGIGAGSAYWLVGVWYWIHGSMEASIARKRGLQVPVANLTEGNGV